jgi:hypothetical protein
VSLNTSPAAKTWDLAACVIILMGLNIQSGFDEDDVLEIEPEAETFGHKVGADGETTFFRNNNRVNKVTLHLMQSSIANTLLSTLATKDENTIGGAGMGPALIQDLQGTSIFEASNARITKRPTRMIGREVKTRSWEITAIIDVQVDGNN